MTSVPLKPRWHAKPRRRSAALCEPNRLASHLSFNTFDGTAVLLTSLKTFDTLFAAKDKAYNAGRLWFDRHTADLTDMQMLPTTLQ